MLIYLRNAALATACCVGVSVAQQAAEPLSVETPDGWTAGSWLPMAVLWSSADAPADAGRRRALAASGVGCLLLEGRPDAAALGATLARLRQRYRIDQGALHAVIGDRPAAALASLLEQRHEFQTVTVFGAAAEADLAAARRLRARRVTALPGADAFRLARHVRRLHAARALRGAAAEVARALDSFHDAAAVGDEERYFGIFPDDAVFLGTDASERWTGAEFRAFALPYFERDSAWTYVPFERHVTVAVGGQLAWFDEALDNAGYGECRGSGVLIKRDGAWVLQQYNLTVPVPNDLMKGVAQQIRAHLDGR